MCSLFFVHLTCSSPSLLSVVTLVIRLVVVFVVALVARLVVALMIAFVAFLVVVVATISSKPSQDSSRRP